MLTKIGIAGVVDSSGDPAILEVPILGVNPKDSLLLRKITGLDPADVDVFIGDYARDGGFYSGRRVQKRNPVFYFDLNPNPALGETVSGLRELLYKAFLDPRIDADHVKVTLHDDLGRVRYLVGYAEKNSSDIFDTSDNMLQVSMICPDPFIRNDTSTIMQIPTYVSAPTSGWGTLPAIPYDGTAETGFEVEIRVISDTLTMTLELNGQTMILDGSTLASTQAIYINTNRGSRAVYSTAASNLVGLESMDITDRWAYLRDELELTVSLVDLLTPTSPWLELHSQANTMKIYGATPSDAKAVVRILKFTPSYWGI